MFFLFMSWNWNCLAFNISAALIRGAQDISLLRPFREQFNALLTTFVFDTKFALHQLKETEN
jgi:hypothetical protein